MRDKDILNPSMDIPNYKEYLEKINSDLEKIKEEFADPLDGVLKYDKNWRCITFFWDKGTSNGNVPNGNITKEDIENKEGE